eukprot:gene9200-16874_t
MREFLKVACFLWFAILFANGRLLSKSAIANPGQAQSNIEVITEVQEEVSEGVEVDEIQMIMENNGEKIKVGHSHREYPTEFHLNLKYANLTFLLKVKANDVMMGVKPKLIYYDNNGKRIVDDDHDDGCCYYQGYDVNTPNTSVAISVCEDGMDGVIMMGDRQLVIKPSKKKMYMRESADRFTLGPHVLKESLAQKEEKLKFDYVHIPENLTINHRAKRSLDQMTETKYIELYMLVDHTYFVWMENSVDKTMKRIKQVSNIVDSLYFPLNVRVVLLAVDIWTDGNKMNVDKSISGTLERLYDYRKWHVLPKFENDCTILVSRVEFDGPAIGLAPLSGMCNTKYSCNVCQDTTSDLTILAGTMAHEMGHNLGMDHDKYDCRCSHYACLMNPYSQNPMPKRFSECSEWDFKAYLRKDLAYCLMNVPDFESGLYIDDRTCGNNKIDPGEECDCGKPRYCQNPCCDAFRCRLKKTSQCYEGGCCVDCKIQPRDTICRRSKDFCDYDDKCDGNNPECPEDAFSPNGEPCKEYSRDGYCYDGQCRTLKSQCRYVWGGMSKESNSVCFNTLNTRGDERGNCGYAGGYIRCSGADAMCGRLFCTNVPAHDSVPIIGFMPRRYTMSVWGNGQNHECVTAKVDLGRQAPDPISVFTGVKCGDGKACKAGKCIPVTEIASPPCIDDCHGNGLCTHKGTCLCISGYAPPTCDKFEVVEGQNSSGMLACSFLLSLLIPFATYLLM